jgi:hypothetical protein
MASALALLKAYWKPLLAIALLVAALATAYHRGQTNGEAAGDVKVAKLTADHAQTLQHLAELATRSALAARDAEHAQADAITAVAAHYEQAKTHAQALPAAVAADLHAGVISLRQQWTCPAPAITRADLSAPGGAAARPDANAALRNQGAGDLVGLAAEADAQVAGLQQALLICTAPAPPPPTPKPDG